MDKNILCSSLYPSLILTYLCHSLSTRSHIHFSLPSGSVNPFCTPLVHFLWPPPSHLSNGGIVLMDCPKQQRGGHSCHSTSTPPLHSYPLHPSVCNRSGNMHSFFFFTFLCLVAQATPSSLKRNSFTWIDQVAGVPCYSVTPNKQESSHFGQQEKILGIMESDLKLAQNLSHGALIWVFKKSRSEREWKRECQRSLKAWRKVSVRRAEGKSQKKRWQKLKWKREEWVWKESQWDLAVIGVQGVSAGHEF